MIHRIFSDLPSFKELRFTRGLNLILAEQSAGATSRQTRNGVGKTSFIELVHFLMGSDASKDSLFRKDELLPFQFGVEADLFGRTHQWLRSGSSPSKFNFIDSNETSIDDRIARLLDKDNSLNTTSMRSILGDSFFDIDEDIRAETAGPTFRSLFSYFARRERSGAFGDPFRQASQQQTGDRQVALSYLLDFDWTIPQAWELVRKREKSLKNLRDVLKEGALGAPIGTASEIRSLLAIARSETDRLRSQIDEFVVEPAYVDLESEADDLTRQIAQLRLDNAVDQDLFRHLSEAIDAEDRGEPSVDRLDDLYREVGVLLPESVNARLEDVRTFHTAVVENRRSYLDSEIASTERRIEQRHNQMETLDRRRAPIMGILRSSGAIDTLIALQGEQSRLESRVETLESQYETAVQVESDRVDLEVERAELQRRLARDIAERSALLDRIVVAFEELSRELYEEPGTLVLDETRNGPEWQADVPAAMSRGIGNMQVLCFDLVLMRMLSERGAGPGFLIHDSHIFDGVDERQVATGLRLGAEMAERNDFQYIVTMNTDVVPSGFDADQYRLPVELTDSSVDGGLFGIRFD